MTHCRPTGAHAATAVRGEPADRTTTVLVGNPNVGKSVLFRNLTNRYVTVSNYPGTTVEIVRAAATFDERGVEVIDTPGLNDLAPRSEDARVTLELLGERADATVVQVADAKNLRRALMLTLQLAELGRPMVLVLNMMDELEARGGEIDAERLSRLLGIPVVTTVAPRDRGTADLVAALARARPVRLDPVVLEGAGEGSGDADPDRLPVVMSDALPPDGLPPVGPGFRDARGRLAMVKELLRDSYSISPPENPSLGVRLGFWAMHPLKGLGFLAVVLLAVFWFVGLFGAGTLVDLLEVAGFEQRLSPLAIRAADVALPFPHRRETELISHPIGLPVSPVHEIGLGTLERMALRPDYAIPTGADPAWWQRVMRFVHDLLVGPYGTITMALSYALAIVLPIVTTFFLVFSVLEDSG